MFGFFRKKTPLDIMFKDLCEYYIKCDMAHKIEAGIVINVLHSGFLKSYGDIASFKNLSDQNQKIYLDKVNLMQGDRRTRVGASFFLVWLLSEMIGDFRKHDKIEKILIDLSRISESVNI